MEEILISIVKEYYSQGDDYFAFKKKGHWIFGYSNDYPMQHGQGKTFKLPEELIIIMLANNGRAGCLNHQPGG